MKEIGEAWAKIATDDDDDDDDVYRYNGRPYERMLQPPVPRLPKGLGFE